MGGIIPGFFTLVLCYCAPLGALGGFLLGPTVSSFNALVMIGLICLLIASHWFEPRFRIESSILGEKRAAFSYVWTNVFIGLVLGAGVGLGLSRLIGI